MQILGDKTVIATTYQNVLETQLFDEVFVATDSEIILKKLPKSAEKQCNDW